MEQPTTDPTGGKKADRKQIHISFISDEQDSYVSIRVNEFDIRIDSKPFPKPEIKDSEVITHEHPRNDGSAGAFQRTVIVPCNASTDTENVKVKGDLVALRYIVNSDGDSNITDFETHCPLSCQDYDDDALLVYCDEFVENGEWLVFHKNTVHLGMFKIITHDEFNSKLKHLFD